MQGKWTLRASPRQHAPKQFSNLNNPAGRQTGNNKKKHRPFLNNAVLCINIKPLELNLYSTLNDLNVKPFKRFKKKHRPFLNDARFFLY